MLFLTVIALAIALRTRSKRREEQRDQAKRSQAQPVEHNVHHHISNPLYSVDHDGALYYDSMAPAENMYQDVSFQNNESNYGFAAVETDPGSSGYLDVAESSDTKSPAAAYFDVKPTPEDSYMDMSDSHHDDDSYLQTEPKRKTAPHAAAAAMYMTTDIAPPGTPDYDSTLTSPPVVDDSYFTVDEPSSDSYFDVDPSERPAAKAVQRNITKRKE